MGVDFDTYRLQRGYAQQRLGIRVAEYDGHADNLAHEFDVAVVNSIRTSLPSARL